MKAHVEWIVGVIRAGPEFKDFGDPYEFSCTVIRRGDTCEIIGASGRMFPGLRVQLRKLLDEQGIKHCVWDRARGKHVETKV